MPALPLLAKRPDNRNVCRLHVVRSEIAGGTQSAEHTTKEKSEVCRSALIESIRNGSAATWSHFNLHGEFDFSDEWMVDSIGLTPPKYPGLEWALNWEIENRWKTLRLAGLRKILWNFRTVCLTAPILSRM